MPSIQSSSLTNRQELSIPVEVNEPNDEIDFCNTDVSNEINVPEQIPLEDSEIDSSENDDDDEDIVSIFLRKHNFTFFNFILAENSCRIL